MKNNIVDIVVLIDRSGSMANMEAETIGAFNAFLEDQKAVEGEAVLTLVLFDLLALWTSLGSMTKTSDLFRSLRTSWLKALFDLSMNQRSRRLKKTCE